MFFSIDKPLFLQRELTHKLIFIPYDIVLYYLVDKEQKQKFLLPWKIRETKANLYTTSEFSFCKLQ